MTDWPPAAAGGGRKLPAFVLAPAAGITVLPAGVVFGVHSPYGRVVGGGYAPPAGVTFGAVYPLPVGGGR